MDYKDFFEGEDVQKYARIICELTRECWERGLSDSTGFSISQVIPDTDFVLVDKSGTGFRRNKINESDLLLINRDGKLLYRPNADNPRLAPLSVKSGTVGSVRMCYH